MNANDIGGTVHCYDSERLYLLAEDNNEIYVDNFLLEQHQIDGLRFLFKQFNKKSPGVIVNFPPSCGKSTTVAIFLNAVTNVLKQPVLVLCKDDCEVQYWKEILLKWSSYVEHDITVESSNPFIKGKKVFLKKRDNLSSYLRRRWSIIIIKENFVSKDVFKLAFEADFKICITATDIKKDVSLLTAVFNWLHPKPKVNINDFVAEENRPREKFRKSVQLDLILEDVAIRRYINVKQFQGTKRPGNVTEIENTVTEVETNYKKGPLKNKDVTGTKIKRSKIPKDDTILNPTSNRSVVVNDQEINELSGQAFMFINDHIRISQNDNQNIIFINDDQILNQRSNQRLILNNVNEILDRNAINNEQVLNETPNQNVISTNNPELNENSDVITINDDDENESSINNHIKEKTVDRNIISGDDPPMTNENDVFDRDNSNDFSMNNENLDKVDVYKSPINKEINNFDAINDNDSFKLGVDIFIRDQQPLEPVNQFNKLSCLYDEVKSINNCKFTKSSNIDNDSKVDVKEKNDLDDKDLLKEQLIESLHLHDSKVDSKEVENLEETLIKEEATEIELPNENNCKLDLNEVKDLRKQLIDSLGFDSDSKDDRSEIKISDGKNASNSKGDLNATKDIRNKCLLQKQLLESLGFNSDCQEIKKIVNENNNNELNDSKDFDKTIIKDESTESLSLGSNSKVDNEVRDLDTNLIKEESDESLNIGSNSKIHPNEMKDLHDKNMLQKQLIESLCLDDVKPEIKDEQNDEQCGNNENMQHVVQQIATNLNDDEIIVLKVEPEDGNVTNTERNVNNVNNKRKSDVSDKDLDSKILEMEEKALKKFKGSFLDSIF